MNNKAVSTHKPQEDMFNQYLSFSDLDKLQGWKEAWKSGDINDVEFLLYRAGVDLGFGWEIVVNNHRPRTSNLPVYGPRFEFKEREDKEFIQSGMKAVEDIINSCSDSSMRLELKGMSRRDNNTANACKHAQGDKPDI
jgi:hypothetical protein